MAINRKKPIEKRYQESRNKLHNLFYFIFINLEKSNLNFDLYVNRGGREKRIKKEYDTCLLISLCILKLVINSSSIKDGSEWESFGECTDVELLLVRYLAFTEEYTDKGFIEAIGRDRWEKIKIPEICNYFFDEENAEKIKKNNFNKYMRTIPNKMIIESIGKLGYALDREPKGIYIRKHFYDFFSNFINGMTIELPERYKLRQVRPSNFIYYFNLCGRKFEMFWLSLYHGYPEELTRRMDEVMKKGTKL